MGVVVHFPTRPRLICSEITEAQAEAAQSALFDVMGSRPDCTGRGWIFFNRADGLVGVVRCPCGGSDADRIEEAQ